MSRYHGGQHNPLTQGGAAFLFMFAYCFGAVNNVRTKYSAITAMKSIMRVDIMSAFQLFCGQQRFLMGEYSQKAKCLSCMNSHIEYYNGM